MQSSAAGLPLPFTHFRMNEYCGPPPRQRSEPSMPRCVAVIPAIMCITEINHVAAAVVGSCHDGNNSTHIHIKSLEA